MESKDNKKLKKVSNVEKNFIYECEICYEDYDTVKHVPMIVCSNYHALCSQCVKSNLFKREHNAQKNPTGRYMCSKCSEIIQKDDIREHTILKQVCNYIKTIREKDEELRKDFYNHIGTMGMNLVAMRQDFDTIEKNNLILKKENQFLIKQNCRLTDEFNEIQKIKGSLEELQKVAKKVEDMKEIFMFENAKLQSLKDEVKRKDQQILAKRNQILTENQTFFSLQGQITQLREDIKIASKKNKELLEQNEGSINLKQYLQQEINNLQNQKKQILQENTHKKRKINESLKLMQRYWEKTLENQEKSNDLLLNFENSKYQLKDQKEATFFENKSEKNQKKEIQLVSSNKIPKIEEKHQNKSIGSKYEINLFDQSQKFIKNFYIEDQTATLMNDRLTQYTHLTFEEGFNMLESRSFTIKIKKLQTEQIMVGLMTGQCKHKRKVYDKKGFYAIDGSGNVWIDGDMRQSNITIKQDNEIKVEFVKEIRSIIFSKGGKKKETLHLPQHIKNKTLYPVVLLMNCDDSFEILQVI